MSGCQADAVNGVLGWSLLYGRIPLILSIIGVLGGTWLVLRRDRAWWLRVVPIVAAATGLGVVLLVWLVDDVWQPFPDPLPFRVVFWIGIALGGIGLAGVRLVRGPWWQRGVAVVAVLVVVAMAGMKVNAFYGEYPTVRGLLDLPVDGEMPADHLPGPVADPTAPPTGASLDATWHPTNRLPAGGGVVQVSIPAARSTFHPTRDAYVYLPPAYWAANRPLLPVLVLLHGQPGSPSDWFVSGGLTAMLNKFAALHHGLAPVVVLPDTTGSLMGNPLCMDSRLGNAESYLTRDVPDWVRQHLQVDPDTRHWAVAGMSYGGTCALQLALRRPGLFPSFVDISGQSEPTLGDRRHTVAAAFGGDMARFRAVNPADELARSGFPGSAGMFTIGVHDAWYGPAQHQMLADAQHAGLPASLAVVDGGHDWRAWAGGLARSLPWLGTRMGLTG